MALQVVAERPQSLRRTSVATIGRQALYKQAQTGNDLPPVDNVREAAAAVEKSLHGYRTVRACTYVESVVGQVRPLVSEHLPAEVWTSGST
jgi:hypothetical protein